MNQKNFLSQEERQNAKKLAEIIRERHLPGTDFERGSHMEVLWSLWNDEDKQIGNRACDMKGLLIEISCLLSNPEFSCKLSTYYQRETGKLMKDLITFFTNVEICEEEMQAYFDYMYLKYFCGSMTGVEFDRYENKYLTLGEEKSKCA